MKIVTFNQLLYKITCFNIYSLKNYERKKIMYVVFGTR